MQITQTHVLFPEKEKILDQLIKTTDITLFKTLYSNGLSPSKVDALFKKVAENFSNKDLNENCVYDYVQVVAYECFPEFFSKQQLRGLNVIRVLTSVLLSNKKNTCIQRVHTI